MLFSQEIPLKTCGLSVHSFRHAVDFNLSLTLYGLQKMQKLIRILKSQTILNTQSQSLLLHLTLRESHQLRS